MSNMTVLTEQEKQWLNEEGINPDPMGVVYRGDYDLHLRNFKTGNEVIVYWGLKHQREAGKLK